MSAQPVPPARPTRPPLIRVTEAREVLAYVPHALGFAPRESVVLLSLRPPRGRIGLVARVDLGDLAGSDGRLVAAGLGRHLDTDGASGVFVVVYRDEAVAQARRAPAVRAAVDVLERVLTIPVRDTWVVASDGYVALGCEDLRCCPPDGHPLETLVATQIGAAMVLAGSAPVARREDLRVGVSDDPGEAAAFERGRRAERRRRTNELAADREASWRRDAACSGVALLVAGPAKQAADARRLGALAEALRDARVRDAVLLGLLVPGLEAPDPGDLDDHVGRLFGPHAVPPQRPRVDRAREVLTDAARLATGAGRGQLLGILAWLAWWCGEGAASAVLMAEALEHAPADSLALLVDRALETGTAPGWVRHPDR